MEDKENQVVDINPKTQPIAYAQQTRADRLREAASAPDFSIPDIRPVDAVFSDYSMNMTPDMVQDMMRETGVYSSTSKQVSTAIKNALVGMNQLGDEIKISYGNLANYITGSKVGDELAQIAYESITQRYNEMANAEEAVGGIRSNLAQLVGGGTSFVQLALEGLATFGTLPLAHIGVQAFGQGTYNDMKAYADEHDGSLKGYQPKGFDLAANTANTLLQVGIEAALGVGSPRFLVGASRGMWVEGLSGALQEGVQSAVSDLTEAVKGNQDISILLDNAEDYLRDAIVGGILQGAMGAVTHHQNYARAVNFTSEAIGKARGHETPTVEDKQQAKAIIDAKERQEASILTKEFKAAFDASSGEGQLQAKIASALNAAVKNKELDLDTADETELAQRIEQIATQETMNAMDLAREQNRAISDMELNNIVYKDGAIWLEGLTPQVGDRAVSYARVLAERQSGLAEVNMKLDTINQEIVTLKQDLAEAKAQNKEAQVEKLQARIDKQNALAEKNRLQAERLKVQTAKLEKQIAKQEEQVKVAEPVKMAEVKAKKVKSVAERKSLKKERIAKTAPSVDDDGLLHQNDQEKNLIVQHGTTKQKVQEALNLGGVPVPSLAIMKAENSSKQYGEIIFIGGQNLISGESVYTSDIYSARRIKPDLLINDAGEKYIRSLVGSHASFVIGNLDPNYGTYENALMHLYLLEKGVRNDPENIMRREGADFTEEFSKMSDSEQKEFTSWMEDFENKYFSKKIWAGYTPSGRQKYIDYTLENIVKLMAKKPKQGSEEGFGSSPHALKGIWAKPLKSIEEIRKNKDRLVSKEEYEQVDKEFWESINKLTELLRTDYLVQNLPYSYDEHIISTLAQIKKNTDIKALLQENNMNDSDEAVQAVKDFKAFAESVPTKYFEAKPKRAVNFSEFEGVLIPSDKEYDIIAQKLKEAGVKKVSRYSSEQERQQQIQELKPIMFQSKVGSFSSSDKYRGGYDEQLKRIILGEKSDLSTIQHEFAHYWIQNNFKWARSGLASQDWLRRWRDVEEWLGIEPQDRLLSKSASEKFAKAYERYILEGRVAPELQWAFEGFQKAYQDIYDELENEYFDLSEELAPEVIDWFNRNKEQSPKVLLESDAKKIEKTLALEMGVPVVEQTSDNTVAMTEMGDEGKPVTYMGVQESEIPAGDNLLVYSDKATASKLQQSARKAFGDNIEVQKLATLDTEATLENFTNWIKRDRTGAWDAMMNPSTSPIYQAYLYKAFAQEAMNDVNLAIELANVDMAKAAREMGQAIQALNINNESGFDMLGIIKNIEKGKGSISQEELNNSIEEMGLNDVELSQDEVDELENQTECKL